MGGAELDAELRGRVVTELAAETNYWPAEAYHQNYATLNPNQLYIATFDLPKITHLKMLMPEIYRDKPVLVGSHETGSP